MKKISIFVLSFVLILLGLAACTPNDPNNNGTEGTNPDTQDKVVYSLVLESDKTTLTRGEKATLSAVLKAEGKEDIPSEDTEYQIVSGAEYASVSANTITVLESAPHGAVIKVQATEGATKSNILELLVNVPAQSIEVSAGNITNILPGQSAILNYTVLPAGAKADVVWTVTEGADVAQVSGNVLVVAANAQTGSKVKVKATVDGVSSKELEFTVGNVLVSINAKVVGSANVNPGGTAHLSVTLNPQNATDASYVWELTEGSEYAEIIADAVYVKENTPIGTVIKVKAVSGNISSNEVSISVGTPITGIEISTISSLEIVKGNTAILSASITPANASMSLISWVISEGSEYAVIANNNLSISKNAPTGAQIKVKAVFGDVESNELTFVVLPTQEEINATKYVFSLSANNVTVDKKGSSSPLVVGTVYNMNFEKVDNVQIVYSVTEGNQYLQITQDGNNCSFIANGHGKATVTATIPGTTTKATIEVNVIVPPEAIDLPEVFKERTDISYSFSLVDPETGLTEKLPFVPNVRGSALSCKDYVITFMHSSGLTGDQVAVYENGEITFKMKGKVTVIVSSKSGSQVEAQSTAYNFDINEGYNVYSFVDLQKTIMSANYNGLPVNLVVLEKPVANYETEYKYGYDMVPVSALYDLDAKYAHLKEGDNNDKVVAAVVNEILNGSAEYGTNVFGDGNGNRVLALNKSVWINGNNHKIDASKMRVFTLEEYYKYLEVYGKIEIDPNLYELISVMPLYADPNTGKEVDKEGVTMGVAHSVKFYNMNIVGNCPVDFQGDRTYTVVGCYTQGINVGVTANKSYTTDYYVDCNNITVSQFDAGIRIADAVGDSKLSNISAYNCYANGLRIMSSIVKVENMSFGSCGAFAIEVSPKKSNEAGVNENENNKITLSGSVDVNSNLNDGNSVYFNKYEVMPGVKVPTIIAFNVQQYSASQASHLKNSNGQFNFVSLMMINTGAFAPGVDPNVYLNHSEVLYPAYQTGGIIDISQIPDGQIDTTHQYITMTVMVPIDGLGVVPVGTAIFYNMNYGK